MIDAGLNPLIQQAEASEFSHVVVFLEEEAIRWRPESKEACECMADILADFDAKVMTKQEFIETLKEVQENPQ